MIFKFVGALIIAAIVVIGVSTWRSSTNLQQYNNPPISFKYPKDYHPQTKVKSAIHSTQQIKLGVQNPLSIIELNKETGAIIAANATKSPFLDMLEKNAGRTLPLTYPNYNKISSERIKISGRDAALFKFSYTGKDKQTLLYVSFFIIPSGNDAYYLYVQSTDKGRWQNDSKKIQSSLKLS